MNLQDLETDEGISRFLNGAKIMSLYPEDLPHFHAVRDNKASVPEQFERLQALRHLLHGHPLLSGPHNKEVSMLALRYDAAVAWSDHDKTASFVILNSSRTMTRQQLFSRNACLPPHLMNAEQLPHDYPSIVRIHEAGHIDAKMRGLFRSDQWENELYADFYALKTYYHYGGQKHDEIERYIALRYVIGFLIEPYQYWLGPYLDGLLPEIQSPSKPDMKPIDDFMSQHLGQYPVMRAMQELRIRAIDKLELGGRLSEIASKDIWIALDELSHEEGECCSPNAGQDTEHKRIIYLINSHLEEYFGGEKSVKKTHAFFGLRMAYEQDRDRMNPLVASIAERTLESAQLLTPKLLKAVKRDWRAKFGLA